MNDDTKTYKNIRKTGTGQGDDYSTGCLLDYLYLKDNYEVMEIDLGKQQTLDADTRAIQQINFTGNSDQAEGAFSFLKKQKKLFWTFHKKP